MQSRQISFPESVEILEAAGIEVLGRAVQSRDEAVAAAETFGYPVVLKAATEQIVHKTDVGVVQLDLGSAEQVSEAWDRIGDNARAAGVTELDAILVQKMASPGFEMLVGAKQDPSFGPVTMVGTGGRFVELWRDTAPGIGALSPEDVLRMLEQTKAGRVLEGFRGPALDRDAVVEIVVCVSKLMESRPDIVELDLNPVIVYETGCAIVDARIIVGDPVHHPRATDLSYNRMKSLDSIFNAKSVAIVGASTSGSIGGIILKNSSRIDKLYPINPKRKQLLGRRCYASLAQAPEVPELGVFAVGADATLETFEEFCRLGGRGAIIVSDGFAESGRRDREARLIEIAREHDVVYVGPNCLGVIDNFSGLNTLFVPERRTGVKATPSSLGVISQSGGIGLELLEMLDADNLSVGRWVSCGNSSGVSIAEILAHMGDDPQIAVIALYLEGLKNGLQFMEVARQVAMKKPIVVIKGGVGGGAAKTMSHTASLAGSFEAFRAACEQAGIFLIHELTEDPKVLTNVISLLTTQPPAKGDRVAVVSVGGGAAILLADQVTGAGMRLAEFAPETKRRLAELLEHKVANAVPEERAKMEQQITENPVDLFGDCDDDMLLAALLAIDEDPNTDILMVATYFQVPYLSEYVAERLVEAHPEFSKPVIISPRGFSRHVRETCDYLAQHDFQTYTVPMIKPLSIALEIWERYGGSRGGVGS